MGSFVIAGGKEREGRSIRNRSRIPLDVFSRGHLLRCSGRINNPQMTPVNVLHIRGVINSFTVKCWGDMLNLTVARGKLLKRSVSRGRNAIQVAPARFFPGKND